MGRKYNPQKTKYTIIIHNLDTLNLMNDLTANGESRNAIINAALDIGIPLLYERTFSKIKKNTSETAQPYAPSVARELKELRRTVDDLFIEMNIQETMLAGLYNAKLSELEGASFHPEMLRDGSGCYLPELVEGFKSDLTQARGAHERE